MMADRFGISYVNPKNVKVRPVILHRAALGSLERFIGILLENAGGRLPAWMMRNQAIILHYTHGKPLDFSRGMCGCVRLQGLIGPGNFRYSA